MQSAEPVGIAPMSEFVLMRVESVTYKKHTPIPQTALTRPTLEVKVGTLFDYRLLALLSFNEKFEKIKRETFLNPWLSLSAFLHFSQQVCL